MKFLQEIYNESNLYNKSSNIKIYDEGKKLNLKIEIGNNFNWYESEYEKEEAINLDENLLKLFKLKNIDYDEFLENDFFNMREGDYLESYISDESGTYLIKFYLEDLDVNGVSTSNYWINFNNMTKTDLDVF